MFSCLCLFLFFSLFSWQAHAKCLSPSVCPSVVPYTLPLFRLFHLALTLPPTAAAANASTHSDNRFDSFTSFTSCSFALCPSCSLAGRLSETEHEHLSASPLCVYRPLYNCSFIRYREHLPTCQANVGNLSAETKNSCVITGQIDLKSSNKKCHKRNALNPRRIYKA